MKQSNRIGKRLDLLLGCSDFSFLSIPNAGLLPIFAADVELRPGSNTITAVLDALESKNLVKTLAEPNLIALSGETARFLAGGEFPAS